MSSPARNYSNGPSLRIPGRSSIVGPTMLLKPGGNDNVGPELLRGRADY